MNGNAIGVELRQSMEGRRGAVHQLVFGTLFGVRMLD